MREKKPLQESPAEPDRTTKKHETSEKLASSNQVIGLKPEMQELHSLFLNRFQWAITS